MLIAENKAVLSRWHRQLSRL